MNLHCTYWYYISIYINSTHSHCPAVLVTVYVFWRFRSRRGEPILFLPHPFHPPPPTHHQPIITKSALSASVHPARPTCCCIELNPRSNRPSYVPVSHGLSFHPHVSYPKSQEWAPSPVGRYFFLFCTIITSLGLYNNVQNNQNVQRPEISRTIIATYRDNILTIQYVYMCASCIM